MTKLSILKALGVASISLVAATAAFAGGTWSGSLGATSDYKFRGIAQSDEDPAVFGSVEFGHSGFVLGAWASSIDFATFGDTGADIEVDVYAGYTHEFSETTSLTGKVTYYWYPGSNPPPGIGEANYFEAMLGLDHDFGTFAGSLALNYTPDYFGETDSATALVAGVEVPVNGWLSVSANVGHQWFENNALVTLPDYWFGDIGATATWDVVSLDVRYVATDIDTVNCFAGTVGASGYCDSTLVVTLTLSKSSGDE
jgi:uncharacterized protein (TIGR02001 family)